MGQAGDRYADWEESQSYIFSGCDHHFSILTSLLLQLISKSKEMETILDLSTIKLEELFEDNVFTQCNHTLFVLVK